MNSRRQQKVNAHLQSAKAYADLSYSKRLKVGAVIVKDDRIMSVGYNGTVMGADNRCELFDPRTREWFTKPEVVHAEENCIVFAARNGVSTEGTDLVTTHTPCFECAKLIIQAGIKRVYFETDYRDVDPVTFLKKHGVKVERIGNG